MSHTLSDELDAPATNDEAEKIIRKWGGAMDRLYPLDQQTANQMHREFKEFIASRKG